MKRSLALIAPYAAWMVLMAILPQTAGAYALRGVATLLALAAGAFLYRRRPRGREGEKIIPAFLVGLLVFFVWIAPEPWLWPASSSPCPLPSPDPLSSPYSPAVCGWPLTIAKLCASAFVISIAEELFFRKWLVEFAGFGWMLVLFGVEHMRWDLGAGRGCVFIAEGIFAGLAYGLLAKRCGIVSAIVAHAVTNLVLGLYVIGWDKWFYW